MGSTSPREPSMPRANERDEPTSKWTFASGMQCTYPSPKGRSGGSTTLAAFIPCRFGFAQATVTKWPASYAPGARTCSRGWRENSRASGLALLIAHRSRRSRGSSSTTSSFDEPNTAIGVADFPSSTPPCSSAVPDPSRPPCRPFWPASRRTFSRSRGGGGCVYSTPRHVVQQATSATQHPQHRQQLVHWQQLQLKGLPEE